MKNLQSPILDGKYFISPYGEIETKDSLKKVKNH